MEITQASLQALQTSFSSIFRSAYRDTPEFGSVISTQVPSSTSVNTYGWMRRLLEMRKWEGPRVAQNLNTHAYTLENEDYEATLACDRNDIEDDQLGLFSPRVQELGRVARRFKDQLLLAVIAENPVGFDGVTFFNDAHPLDPAGTQDNVSTETFGPDNWQAVRARMQGYTGEDGRPLGVNPNLVVIPPEYERMAKHIFQAPLAANGGTNVQNGEARYLVIPEWAGTNQWYALDVSAPIKPFLFQLRKAPVLVSKTSMTDDNVFREKEFLWGLDARGAAGVTCWWLAHKSTGAVEAVTQLPAA